MLGETEWTGYLAAMASEVMDDIYPVPATGRRGGKYLLVFDPLHGPGDIDASVSVGTIFSILRSPDPGGGAASGAFPAAGHRSSVRGLRLVRAVHHADPHHR